MPEGQGVGQSRKRAKPRNLSCTPDITTGVLGGRLNTSRFSSSNTQRFPVCKGDPSAALGMTVLGSSLSVSLGTFDLSASRILIKEVRVCAHHLIEECQYPWSLIPNPCFQISGGVENSAFPVSSFRAKPRNLSCTPDITTGVLGGRLNTSRFSSSNIQRFPACKGDPSAALGMTVRGSSRSVSLGTFDLSASRILIKEVRVCAHHLIEERQYPWSLIPNPCFQISGFGG